MRWYQRYSHYLIGAAGCLLFACVAVVSFCLLISQQVGMDSLIAFLLSQALGLLVLHFMRHSIIRVLGQRESSHRYGVFLLVNAAVVLTNALVMYVLDLMSSYNETAQQIFSTAILLCVNIIMQLQHLETMREEQ